ncbi:MAG: glycosyltransferase [Planctomycetota bacterium]|nr:MAG: glycosyltransferase [Planctomycetota bacterium]
MKGHALLLEAVRQVIAENRSVHVLIVGDGPERDRLESLARRWGIERNVHLVGKQHPIEPWYACMDVYVCSSRYEGMSNAVLEAMACGLPVISTDVGDHAQVIRADRDGWIVPPDDADALCKTIRSAVSDARLRRRFGASARRRSERLSLRKTAAAYEGFYAELVGDHHDPHPG